MSRELTPTKHKKTEHSKFWMSYVCRLVVDFWMALVVVTGDVRVSKLHLRVNKDTCMCDRPVCQYHILHYAC